MKRMKLTTAGRVVILVIVLALLAGIGGFGYNYYKNNIADDKPISSGTQFWQHVPEAHNKALRRQDGHL